MPRLSGTELAIAAGRKPWTEAEDDVIRARYLTDGGAAVAAVLNRSLNVVYERARRKLGLRKAPQWTELQDRRLRLLWGEKTIEQLEPELGRSKYGIYDRAYDLGLPIGCPQGYEYFTAAAERTGFTKGELWRVLSHYKVPVRRAMSRPAKGVTSRRHVVEPDAVDEAIEQWLQAEVLAVAAKARGIVPSTLERWLVASGLPLPKKPGKRRRWRIPTTTIDAAIAARVGLETIEAAARRNRVNGGTLRSWAKRSGLPRPPGKDWLVKPEVIDRVVEQMKAA